MEAEDNYSRRGEWQRRGASSCRKGSGRATNVYTSQTQYLNANHQFLLFNGSSVRACLADPDYLVEWDDVDVVIVGVDEKDIMCPICLSPAICSRVTSCGHIYCFVCILRHFGPEKNFKASCPMCYKTTTYPDLRGIVIRVTHPVVVGCTSRFVLVRRERTSLIPLTATLLDVAGWDADLDEEPREGWRSSDLSRVAIANPSCTIERLSLEGKTLCKQHQEFQSDGDMEALRYVEWAIQLVEEQMKSVIKRSTSIDAKMSSFPPAGFEGGIFNTAFEQSNTVDEVEASPLMPCQDDRVASQQDSIGAALGTMPEGSSSSSLTRPPYLSSEGERTEEGRERSLDGSHDEQLKSEKGPTSSHVVANLIVDGEAMTKNSFSGGGPTRPSSQSIASKQEHQQSCPEPPNLSFFSFYQLSDGVTLAFLHPLCMRSMLEEYGNDPLALPTFIEARVLEVERVRLTKDVKNRYAFLRHLPQLCIIAFVELDLSENLSSKTLKKFRPEILKRARRRNVVVKREEALHSRSARRQKDKVESTLERMNLNEPRDFPILMGDGAPSATPPPSWENECPELQQHCIEPPGGGGWMGERGAGASSAAHPSFSFRDRLLNQIPDNFEHFPLLSRSSPNEPVTMLPGGPSRDIMHHQSSTPSPTWVVSSPNFAISELDSPSKQLDPLPIGRRKRGNKKGVKMSLLSHPNPDTGMRRRN